MVVRFGDRVIVENPGFPPIFDLLDHVGAVRVPVALDEDGMRPDSLAAALRLRPSVIVLQPRAQNPTGRSLTRARAQELARVIRNSRTSGDIVIIEDDHSGEISASRDVSLGTWLPDQVIHIRSFSKSHGPDLRIAALGGPTELVDQLVVASHPRARLDLADAADDPARPAHHLEVRLRGQRRPARVPGEAAQALRGARQPRGVRPPSRTA